ncbi:uncharacterized protein N0V89_012308 [Didymosphaeria variabile]|uniref:FAD-binding PCMH-type domain-containing protein n=1 Tax=Didymosphaeria variabile TaxID=1932322 RepID=A0A9W9C4W0_9PLEO|nr:uncharacterized protein N0V89_012308 [Didymosphaeria variabile]KAJ4344564.1 hypothetical protein N0V89_012308 [Didymosphaeria variabile]
MKPLLLSIFAVVASAAHPYCLPGQPCFPSESALSSFNASVNGRLIAPIPAGSPCYETTYNAEACKAAASKIGDFEFRVSQPGGVMYTNFELGNTTKNPGCPLPELPKDGSAPPPIAGDCTLGQTASYVVNVTDAVHIAQAVRFAAKYNLRFRIKNSGHDYTGRSTGEGAFTIWTHYINDAQLIKAFNPCGGYGVGQDVISAGAGVNVAQLYEASGQNGVVTIGGYTATVGVAGGYVLGGGTGPFGALFGLAVDNVIQFDVVTADGEQKIANACSNPELFWALRGGGGAFAVVTRAYFRAYPAFTAVNTFFGLIVCSDKDNYAKALETLVDQQGPLREAGQLGIWSANKALRTITIISFRAFNTSSIASPEDAVRLFKPVLASSSCKATNKTAQFTGRSSWNDAYKAFVLPIISQGGPVGINILNISRMIKPAMAEVGSQMKKLAKYIADLPPEVSFLWQNDIGVATPDRYVAADSTAVNPRWRETFAFINAPVTGPRNGTVTSQQLAEYGEVFKASDEEFGSEPYYNEEWSLDVEDWQARSWGSNYARLLEIKNQVDPDRVFNCPRCVGSEDGY